MKPLDPVNTSTTWNIGAIVAILGVVGTVITNPDALSALGLILSNAPFTAKIAAVGVLLGIIAVAIGKPPATSSAQKG